MAAGVPVPESLESKRFILTRNESAKPRLDTFKQTVLDVKKTNPEVIGATLFGSMVKDTADSTSDIDAFVFVDLDSVKDSFTKEDYDRVQPELSSVENPPLAEDLIMRDRLKPLLVQPLVSQGMKEEDLKDIRVRVVNQQLIERELAKSVTSTRAINEYDHELDEIIKADSSKFFEWTAAHRRPEPYFMDWRVSSMFHLAIGRDIQKYRGVVLDYLTREGEVGNQVWKQEVISRTADMERHLQGSNYPHLYPQTVADAGRYFRIPISDKSG